MSLYFWVYAMNRIAMPKPLRILSVMLVIWTAYGLWPIMFGMEKMTIMPQAFSALKWQYLSLLPIFSFYVFVRKGWLTEQMLTRWFFAFLIVAIANYYKYQNQLLEMDLTGRLEGITNNSGYIVLSLFPLLPLFWRKPILQYSLLAVIMLYVLMALKRGAILAGVFCSVWMIVKTLRERGRVDSKTARRKIIRLLLSIGFVVFVVYAVQNMFLSNEYFRYRYDSTLEGASSDRDIIYGQLLRHFFNESNVISFLFGNGAYGTVKVVGTFAHNDWLEIAIDNGVIFLIIYLIYWISLVKMLLKGEKSSATTLMLGLFIIIYFLKTLFSMSYNDLTPYAACALGYAMAKYEYKNSVYVTH